MSDLTLPAAEFKTKCLALIDRVRDRGEPINITKRGRVVARLVPAGEQDDRPWVTLRGRGRWTDDRTAPVVKVGDVVVLARRPRRRSGS